jgi:hypothetical protein
MAIYDLETCYIETQQPLLIPLPDRGLESSNIFLFPILLDLLTIVDILPSVGETEKKMFPF